MERETLIERDFQRVSISGEEKCGVRTRETSFSLSQNITVKQRNNFTALNNLGYILTSVN